MTSDMFPELQRAVLDEFQADPEHIRRAAAVAAWDYASRVMLVWYQTRRDAALQAGDIQQVMHYDGLITYMEAVR